MMEPLISFKSYLSGWKKETKRTQKSNDSNVKTHFRPMFFLYPLRTAENLWLTTVSLVWKREHWSEMDWLFEKGNKKRINVHATWYKFAKCNLDRCKEQHSNNISIIISEKIKQQTKELFALIKFQERYRCGIWTCLGFIQNLRHPQNGFFEKLYLSTHITLIFFSRPSPLLLPLYHSLKRVISFGYVWRPKYNISKEVKKTSYSFDLCAPLYLGIL